MSRRVDDGGRGGRQAARAADRPGGAVPARVALVGCGGQARGLARALGETGIHTVILSSADRDGPEAERLEDPSLGVDTVVVGPGRAKPDVVREIAGTGLLRGYVTLALVPDNDPEPAGRLVRAGAAEIVTPPHSAAAVVLRRRLAEARGVGERRPDDSHRITLGRLELDTVTREVHAGAGATVHLSGREFDLLVRLVRAEGRVVPRRRLKGEIWGRDNHSESALDASIHRLRRRLAARGFPPEVVETVRGVGYRLAPAVLERGEG